MTISSCTNKNWKMKSSFIVSNQHNTGKLLQPIEEIPEAITNTNSSLYFSIDHELPGFTDKFQWLWMLPLRWTFSGRCRCCMFHLIQSHSQIIELYGTINVLGLKEKQNIMTVLFWMKQDILCGKQLSNIDLNLT